MVEENQDEAHMEKVYSKIESYLLPPSSHNNHTTDHNHHDLTAMFFNAPHRNHNVHRVYSATPVQRLEYILYELAVGDHIRSLQAMYRDPHDQQLLAVDLRLCLQIRNNRRQSSDHKSCLPSFAELGAAKLPMKELLLKLIEGRARALTLLRLTHTDQSISYLRGLFDLANIYALHGMWTMTEEKLILAQSKIISLDDSNQQNTTRLQSSWHAAITAAKHVVLVYTILRRHAIAHAGQIKRTFIKEILEALTQNIASTNETTAGSDLSSSQQFITSLHAFFNSTSGSSGSRPSKVPLKQLAQANSFLGSPTKDKDTAGRSWGEVIDHFRFHCEAMQTWFATIDSMLLPQHKAILTVSFIQCDQEDRKLAHPLQLSLALQQSPAAMRLCHQGMLINALQEIPVEVPLTVNAQTGSVQQLPPAAGGTGGGGGGGGKQKSPVAQQQQEQVCYELPVTYEEYLSLAFLHSPHLSSDIQLSLLKVQILSLKGLTLVHLGNLTVAEETLSRAIKELEHYDLESHPIALDLYNAIAQMLLSKHQHWHATKKQRFQQEAEDWLRSEDKDETVRKLLKRQIKIIKKHYNYRAQAVTAAEIDYEARQVLLKRKMKELYEKNEENDQMIAALQAAYRYLVKTVDLLEDIYAVQGSGGGGGNVGGSGHTHTSPLVLATSCIAVASVLHSSHDLESSREWLSRSLRLLDKTRPLPARTIAFVQTQLATILSRLGHDEEARRVIGMAAAFYCDQSRLGIDALKGGDGAGSGQAQQLPVAYGPPLPMIMKHTQLDDDLQASIESINQLICLAKQSPSNNSNKFDLSLHAEELARLLESGYGWDHHDTAEAYRIAGQRCYSAGDYNRAIHHLNSAIVAFQALLEPGQKDKDGKIASLHRMMETAKRKKAEKANAGKVDAAGVVSSSPRGAAGNNKGIKVTKFADETISLPSSAANKTNKSKDKKTAEKDQEEDTYGDDDDFFDDENNEFGDDDENDDDDEEEGKMILDELNNGA